MPSVDASAAPICYGVLRARWLDGPSDEIQLTRPLLRVGRQPDNDLVVQHGSISGTHLEITFAREGVWVRDLGSRNGTFLNAERLPANQRALLPVDATLRLANSLELRLSPPPATGGAAMATPARLYLLPKPQPGLVIQQRSGQVQQIPLGEKPLKIGRNPDNDIVIADPVVSGRHAEILSHGGGRFSIEDLESRNGLTVRGQRIKSKPLRPGDALYIADQVRIEFRSDLCFASQLPAVEGKTSTEPIGIDLEGKKTIRIGRAPENELRIDDGRVSRYHAVIERVGMRYRIRDLHSHNGTFVNGKRVEKEQFIAEGDTIHVANVKMRFAEDGLQQTDGSGLRLDLMHLNKVVGKGKNLLQDISLSIRPREFVALVGTGGAGKSTLLDAMNGFRPATYGQVLVNGVDLYRHYDAYRTELGYVPQKDIMHHELTVHEALDYAAQLRMPADTSPKERETRIQQVLRELDMEHRRDLPIHKLSGGQQKRVSLGVELLTRPRLFFLDEATTGQDPALEREVMNLLRQLTIDPQEGRTIIIITHATKNVMLCDQVIFLTKGGYLAFFGPPDEALKYFDQYRGQEAKRLKPDFEFDDIYDLIDPDKALPPSASEKEKLALAAAWAQRYRQSPYYQKYVADRAREIHQTPQPSDPQRAGAATRQRPRTSPLRQFGILSSRSLAVLRRDPKSLAVLLAQAPLIGIMSLINLNKDIFTPGKGNQGDALQTLFLATIIVLLFGTVNAAREFTKEIPIYKRERMVNLKITPYVFSKVFVSGMFCLYQVAFYLFFTYFTTDWPNELMGVGGWTQLYLTLTLASLSGIMLGLLLSALSSNDGQAVALIPVILIPQFIFAGVMMPNLASTPVIPQIATSKWAVSALANITYVESLPLQSSNSETARKQKEAEAAYKQQEIQKEVDKIVAERLPTEVEKALADEVQKATDEQMRIQTELAQNKAEVQARKQMEGQILMTQAQKDQQVAKARQQAAAQVAANRPAIETQMREKLRPAVEATVRAELTERVRAEVSRNLSAATDADLTGQSDLWSHIFGTRTVTDWAAMAAIMLALLGIILVLIKRKDVV